MSPVPATFPSRPRVAVASLLALLAGSCGGDAPPAADLELLQRPDDPAFGGPGPDRFRVRLQTTKGDMVLEVDRAWAPHGADRFHALVRNGFYDDIAFFRVIDGFIAQFGMHGTPPVAAAWAGASIPDDLPARSNTRGTVAFAMRGPNTRTSQAFINLADNPSLDGQGFAPFGQIVEGMEVADALHSGYGEMPPQGGGPAPGFILRGGNDWLRTEYPRLDFIRRATIESDAETGGAP